MARVPVKFGPDSGPARSRNASAGPLQNMFVEAAPDSKSPYVLYSTPGLKTFGTTGSSLGCRGGIRVGSDFYTVFGETIFKVTSGGASTAIATLPGTDNISMAVNRATVKQVAIAAQGKRYILAADVLTEILDADLPQGPIGVVYLDGYFVWVYSDGVMYQSGLNNGTAYNALDFAEAEAKPDSSRSIGVLGDRLVNFGAESVEFFYNAAPAEGFSFSPQPGALIDRGILSARCWADFDNTITWIDDQGIVVRGEGTIARDIGSYPVEADIQNTIKKQQQADIVVSTWSFAGHEMLQIWANDWCWCFDASTQKWFKRASQDRDSWRGLHFFRVFNKTIVGDAYTGILYEQDDDTFVEGSNEHIRECVSNYVHAGPGRLRHDAIYLDIEVGVGDASGSADVIDPEIVLSWSDDAGRNWQGYRQISIGQQGKYETQVKSRVLGISGQQGRVYRVTFSPALPFTLLGAYADVTELRE